MPGCAAPCGAQTPSIRAPKAARRAHAPGAVVNLGCNGTLLRAGSGDSVPASPRLPQRLLGCPPHILPACDSSSNPRDWFGVAFAGIPRGGDPRVKSSNQGRCNPNLPGLDTFNPARMETWQWCWHQWGLVLGPVKLPNCQDQLPTSAMSWLHAKQGGHPSTHGGGRACGTKAVSILRSKGPDAPFS